MDAFKKTISLIPHAPGVYRYFDHTGTVIYIGKAKDLKKRVSSYFRSSHALGYKTAYLVPEIKKISFKKTLTEFDALLLEAKLIKKYQPKYNSLAKDDKSPVYLVITTHEVLPRILFCRQTELPRYPKANIFGPFQSSRFLRMLLSDIRHGIPFCTQKIRTGRPCFYSHIGLCNPCPSAITGLIAGEEKNHAIRTYRSSIQKITAIFSGKSHVVLTNLEKRMQECARLEQFEESINLRNMIQNLRNALLRSYDPMIFESTQDIRGKLADTELSDFLSFLQTEAYPNLSKLSSLECFDISHSYGTYTVGSMVRFENGFPDTSHYRRFRIRHTNTPNDVKSMEEVITRRLTHTQWNYPDCILVDGGKGQVHAALRALTASKSPTIPIIGLAKRLEEIIVPVADSFTIITLPPGHAALRLLQRIRDESHRFAISYHKLLRKTAYI